MLTHLCILQPQTVTTFPALLITLTQKLAPNKHHSTNILFSPCKFRQPKQKQSKCMNPSARKCQALPVGLRSCMFHHHLLHKDNECSTTDFTMELRRYNYILHKFLAHRADLFSQCGAEHHDLLLVWCHAEYFLDISSHI